QAGCSLFPYATLLRSSGAVARILEVELGDPAACDVDGHEYGAGDSRMRDADGGTLVAAVVVVGDAGMIPRELVAVPAICRSIDVDRKSTRLNSSNDSI